MPKFLRVIGKGFEKVGFTIGQFNTRLLMTISYYLLLFPIGLIRRTFRGHTSEKGWIERDPLPSDHFKKQF
ncbi:MAG: hypothetical protein JSU96_14015 [Acidobacteriota bacterium]|nr:MAG: hypothetical protein JSU96_14015 [Acidobacteriota bacterium]